MIDDAQPNLEANTLAAILQTLQAQQQALTLLVKNAQQPTAAPAAIVSHNISFDKFDPRDDEDFSSYLERFDIFLQMRGILNQTDTDRQPTAAQLAKIEEDKKKILLNCLQKDEFRVLQSETQGKKPSEVPYKDLIAILKKKYDVKVNLQTMRHRFLSRVQLKNESLTDYMSALKVLGRKCKWECPDCDRVLDTVYQAQFIRGISSQLIREKLLQMESNTTLEQTIEAALACEAAHKQNTEDFQSTSYSTVHKLTTSFNQYQKKPRDSQQQQQNVSQADHNFQRNRSNSRNRSDSYSSAGPQKRSRSRYNRNFLEKLGIHELCLCCAKPGHTSAQCRVRQKLKCTSCGKAGHVAAVCIQTKKKEYHDTNYLQVIDICSVEAEMNRKIMVTVHLNGKEQTFELDTGSGVSILSQEDYDCLKLNLNIQDCPNIAFRVYNRQLIFPLGFCQLSVRYKRITRVLKLFVVREKLPPILGRAWIRVLKIIDLDELVCENDRVVNVNSTNIVQDIFAKFSEIFTPKIGKIPNVQCALKLSEKDSAPVYKPPRRVPYALLPKVNVELDRLEEDGVISKVEYCPWGTPLVIVPKRNGDVRICADYAVTVNKKLEPVRYPIPNVEALFNSFNGSTYFCVIDLYKAYLHIELDDASSKIAAISTHRGTYQVNRLFFGLATTPSLFHAVLDPILKDLQGVESYFDDIVAHGITEQQCYERVIALLSRLQKFNIHVNKEKCKFFNRQINYLGHVISEKGLEKNSEKVEALVQAPRPTNEEQLHSFLGLVTYYGKFIPNLSTIAHPLNALINHGRSKTNKGILKKPFIWTEECERAFTRIKSEIVTDQILVTYDPKLPLTLETDASPYGLGAVLSHQFPDGQLKPIAFISRSLTAAEKNYSHADKEATSIYWSCHKFYQYLYGRHFTLLTDSKPVSIILNPSRELPQITALRLTRYALFLRQFDYEIKHRAGVLNLNADFLSQLPLPNTEKISDVDEVHYVYATTLHFLSSIPEKAITHTELREATQKDTILGPLFKQIEEGTCDDYSYSLHDGVIMRGPRVCIPESLQSYVLNELHITHEGAGKMKNIARSICYWPSINKDIESLARSCAACASVATSPPKVQLHPWEEPTQPWQRIHADFAGPPDGTQFFIVIDAYSKWLEVKIFPNAPTSNSVIKCLREIFAAQGLPCTLVTDNATIFKSGAFAEFLNQLGITHRTSAPNRPATNGQAERLVQTFKRKLAALTSEKHTDLHEKVQAILFQYRSTPLATGSTPAEIHYGRQLRTRLHLLLPTPTVPKRPTNDNKIRTLQLHQRVLSRNYIGPRKWQLGTVVEKLGRLHYNVKLDGGYVIKRHIDQIKVTECPPVPENNEHQILKETPKVQFSFPLVPGTAARSNSSAIQEECQEVPVHQPEVRRSTRQRKRPQRLIES